MRCWNVGERRNALARLAVRNSCPASAPDGRRRCNRRLSMMPCAAFERRSCGVCMLDAVAYGWLVRERPNGVLTDTGFRQIHTKLRVCRGKFSVWYESPSGLLNQNSGLRFQACVRSIGASGNVGRTHSFGTNGRVNGTPFMVWVQHEQRGGSECSSTSGFTSCRMPSSSTNMPDT